jgi:hypothetical protein
MCTTNESLFLVVAVNLFEQALLLSWLFLLQSSLVAGLLLLRGGQTAHKAVNLTGGVDDALLARIEGMAVRANVEAQYGLGRPYGPNCTTSSTSYARQLIFRVNTIFHAIISLHSFRLCHGNRINAHFTLIFVVWLKSNQAINQ